MWIPVGVLTPEGIGFIEPGWAELQAGKSAKPKEPPYYLVGWWAERDDYRELEGFHNDDYGWVTYPGQR